MCINHMPLVSSVVACLSVKLTAKTAHPAGGFFCRLQIWKLGISTQYLDANHVTWSSGFTIPDVFLSVVVCLSVGASHKYGPTTNWDVFVPCKSEWLWAHPPTWRTNSTFAYSIIIGRRLCLPSKQTFVVTCKSTYKGVPDITGVTDATWWQFWPFLIARQAFNHLHSPCPAMIPVHDWFRLRTVLCLLQVLSALQRRGLTFSRLSALGLLRRLPDYSSVFCRTFGRHSMKLRLESLWIDADDTLTSSRTLAIV